MALTTPFDVAFPVNFYSGGDTVKDAFYKHIQEIKRIYGVINAVNADKISSDDYADKLQKHIDATDPHPNYKPSLRFADINGDLDGSRVIGKLANATIDYGKVNGLASYVKGLTDNGQGITNFVTNFTKDRGCAQFGSGGLIVQWGRIYVDRADALASRNGGGAALTGLFEMLFPKEVFVVIPSISFYESNTKDPDSENVFVQVLEEDPASFKFIFQFADEVGSATQYMVEYIALGF